MIKLVPFLITILAFSCTAKHEGSKKVSEDKVYKRFDYTISIQQWNGFYGHGVKYVLNNSRINQYDSTSDASISLGKPLTLYYIDYKPKQSIKDKSVQIFAPIDTTEIKFSEALSDTLFQLTRGYLTNVEFTNYDTIGKLKPIITDDSHGMVELSLEGIKLSATISSINNPTMRTKQLDTLLHFINKFKPREEK